MRKLYEITIHQDLGNISKSTLAKAAHQWVERFQISCWKRYLEVNGRVELLALEKERETFTFFTTCVGVQMPR